MNRQITRALVALITLSFAISVAHADRRTSLGGNMLIPDRDDVFVYPQLAVKNKYNHSASIDFGNAAGVGNALLIAGPNKKSAIGVALHRSDSILSLGGGFYNGSPEFGMVSNNIVPLNFTSGDSTTPLNIADLIYAMKMGKNKLGFRVGFVGQGNEDTADDDHINGQGIFGVRFSAGYSMGKKGDFVFDFSNMSGSQTSGDDVDLQHDANFMNVHVGGRYFLSQKKGFKLGTLFDINFANFGNTKYAEAFPNPDDADDVASMTTIFGLQAGLGPVYSGKVNDKAYTVAFHGHFGVSNVSTEPNDQEDDDESSSMSIMFPGFNIAMEYQLLEWLVFRSGANYSYVINGSSTSSSERPLLDSDGNPRLNDEGEPRTEVIEEVSSAHGDAAFGWNAGFGFLMGNFRIDGTLSEGFMTGGPQFIGGNANGLFGLVSATGKF